MAKLGDRRVKEMFLLFPKTINNHQKWLIYAKWVETYHYFIHSNPKDTRGWVAEYWLDN